MSKTISFPLPALVMLVCVAATPVDAETFKVTSTSDSGPGSLRQAILDANARPGPDHITGARRSGPDQVVSGIEIARVTSPLPVITETVFLDHIRIDGTGVTAGDGLVFESNNNDLDVVFVFGFPGNGLVVRGSGNKITSLHAGVDYASSVVVPNGGDGVLIENAVNTSIGERRIVNGESVTSRNFIVGNRRNGIRINRSTGVLLQSTWTGVYQNGMGVQFRAPNSLAGIRIEDSSDIVIGKFDGENQIAGNGGNGIDLVRVTKAVIYATGASERRIGFGNAGHGIVVEDGTDISLSGEYSANAGHGVVFLRTSGSTITSVNVLENAGDGIHLAGSADNKLDSIRVEKNGGNGVVLAGHSDRNVVKRFASTDNVVSGLRVEDSAGNLIGGQTEYGTYENITSRNATGIVLTGTTTSGNIVQGSNIGSSNGTGNRSHGVVIAGGASGNTVGGGGTTRNAIAANGGAGVVIESGSRNRIAPNIFHCNAGPPIDLGGDGSTPNDDGDLDHGANERQNFPYLNAAYGGTTSFGVEGTLHAKPLTTYTIDVYRADRPSFCPGSFIQSFQVTTDDRGNTAFKRASPLSANAGDRLLPSGVTELAGHPSAVVRAVATDAAGNTSEMSPPTRVRSAEFGFSTHEYLGTERGTSVLVAVARTGDLDWTARVGYRTRNDTAIAGADYTGMEGTLTFVPGESEKTIRIPILPDSVADSGERFTVELLFLPGEHVFAGRFIRATVIVEERDSIITVSDAAIDEGAIKDAAHFRVQLDAPAATTVAFDYRTVAGSAAEGEDFGPLSGRLEIPAGEVAATIAVPIFGDIAVEADEQFKLVLDNEIGAALARGDAIGTLRNDDGIPVLSVEPVTVQEGQNTALRLRRSGLNRLPSSVWVRTVAGSASVRDAYIEKTLITFDADVTERQFSFSALSDSWAEETETLIVELDKVDNLVVPNDRVTVTILDDGDTAIGVESEPLALVGEGDEGVRDAGIVVQLSKSAAVPVNVDFTVSAVEEQAAAGSDFTPFIGTIRFAPGEISKTLYVKISGDREPERSEQFFVHFQRSDTALIVTPQVDVRIVNDDGPLLHARDLTVIEGTPGSRTADLEASVDQPAGYPLAAFFTFDFNTATDEDLLGPLTEHPRGGTDRIRVPVTIRADENHEPDEQFSFTISQPDYARIGRSRGVVTIIDDDPLSVVPELSVFDTAVEEAATGDALARFTLALSRSHDGWIGVDFEATSGTATTADFRTTAGRILFAPGELRKTVAVPIMSDDLKENTEWFFVVLGDASGATLARKTAVATIYDPGEQPRRRRSAPH